MSYEVLARKWRPGKFEDMVGQDHVVRALVNALDAERVHHAFLFTGTRGVGKTTLARILAKCLNCEQGVRSTPCGSCGACCEIDQGRFLDLIEVDAASRAKVDETRDLMENVQFAPARGRFKIYLIDEVHMFSAHSFNALLKTLEEPPPHVKFLLATTDPQKLPVTVLSRCLQFNLRRLPADQIAEALNRILTAEGIGYEDAGTRFIARAADGSMRDALSLLDQAIAYGAGSVSAEDVRSMLGTLDGERIHQLLDGLAAGDAARVLGCVQEIAEQAIDFSTALGELVSTLQRIATIQVVPDVDPGLDEERAALAELAAKMSAEDVQLFYQIGLVGLGDLALSPEPRGGFEMILLRMLAFRPAGSGPSATAGKAGNARSTVVSEGNKSALSPDNQAPASVSEGNKNGSSPVSQTPVPKVITSQTWPEVVDAIDASGLVKQLAANSVVKHSEAGSLGLVVSPAHAHLNIKNLSDKLEGALSRYCGITMRLRVELEEPVDETPADQQRRAVDQRQEAAVHAIESDPNVLALCDAFDAVLDPDSIHPVVPEDK